MYFELSISDYKIKKIHSKPYILEYKFYIPKFHNIIFLFHNVCSRIQK